MKQFLIMSAKTSSILSCTVSNHHHSRRKSPTSNLIPDRRLHGTPLTKHRLHFSMMIVTHKVKMEMNASNNSQQEAPRPAEPPSSTWKNWVLGIMLSMVIPFFRHKGGPFVALKNRVHKAIETVDSMAEVVEELGEAVEKVADEVGDKLPEDTVLKEALCSVEDLAKEAVKRARQAEEIVHKVEEVEKELEKTFAEPHMNQEVVISPKKPEDNR